MPETKRVGRYRLLGRLGRGGMGEVHFARAYGAEGVAKDLCVKLIRAERLDFPGAARRFVTEARLSMGLHHGNIVSVFDFGRSDEGYYLAMEWVEGADLAALLAGGPLAPAIAAHVGAEIARALAYAHGREEPVVHCDVKPGNVLISRAGDVKLADFGTATVTGGGGRSGTPGYMAPEQRAARGVEPRTDVYGLGVVLARMLTDGRDPAAIEDEELRSLALELTRDEPSERPSAAEAANRLEGFVARARAAGASSPREQLASRAIDVARALRQEQDREIEATASFARDGDAVLESLSVATTVPPDEPAAADRDPGGPEIVALSVVEPGAIGSSAEEANAEEPSAEEPSAEEPSTVPPGASDPPPRPARWRAAVWIGTAVVSAALALVYLGASPDPSPPEPAAAATAVGAPRTGSTAADVAAETSGDPPEARARPDATVGAVSGSAPPTSTGASAPVVDATSPRRVEAALSTPRVGRGEVAPASPSRPPTPPARRPRVVRTRVRSSRPQAEPSASPRPADDRPPAHLSINAIPWADVSVDGRPLGITPLFEVPLTPGIHRLAFTNAALGASETRSLELEPGQRRSLVVDLRDLVGQGAGSD